MGTVSEIYASALGASCAECYRKAQRIRELEAQLAALDWTPITPENLPNQNHELLGRCGNGVYYVNEYGGLADYAQLVAEEEWTHFRPINAPQSKAAPSDGGETK